MRTALAVGAAVNLLAAVAVPLSHATLVAWDALALMGVYRELDVNGVIDHDGLRAYQDGRFADDPMAVADFLNQTRRPVLPLALATSTVFVVNAIIFLAVRRRGDRELPCGDTCSIS